MATYTADQFIGKTLVAKKNVTAYSSYPKSTKTKTISSGTVIGKVSAWLKDPDNSANVYWQFPEPYGSGYFYVRHNVNDLKLHEAENPVETIAERLKREKEEKALADKGAFVYYLEKYSKPLLWLGGASLAIKAYNVYSNRTK